MNVNWLLLVDTFEALGSSIGASKDEVCTLEDFTNAMGLDDEVDAPS